MARQERRRPLLAGVGLALGVTATVEAAPLRSWQPSDIIEVTRITSSAVRPSAGRAAYITKTMSLADNVSRFQLFEVDLSGQSPPSRLAEARFLDDLQVDVRTQRWTMRADIGAGVQLYAFDGRWTPLVVQPAVGVGGPDGFITSPSEPEQPTGVVRYGWSPSGRALWYVRVAGPTKAQAQQWRDDGFRYDPATTYTSDFRAGPPASAIELRVWEPGGGDRLVATESAGRAAAAATFGPGLVRWLDDQSLIFSTPSVDASGRAITAVRRYVRSQDVGSLPTPSALTLAAPAEGGLRIERRPDGSRRLTFKGSDGRKLDLGPTDISQIGGVFGAWIAPDGRSVHGVLGPDRLGLYGYPGGAFSNSISQIEASLSACSFDEALTLGVCSRETLSRAPELVSISLRTGAVRVLARPNARYDTLDPLATEQLAWRNRSGTRGSGYVTYPRDYRPGRKYQAIIVTHAADARNQFAFLGFQWGFPIQVWAERGYVVLSVNERTTDPDVVAAYTGVGGPVSVARMQRAMGHEAVATLEAAVDTLVKRGVVDPARVGVAGYSRGGIVATLALSHSSRFRAGISADTALYSASGYWRGDDIRRAYKALFGGHPNDPRALAAYRSFSPSMRADQFEGPLLQLMTANVAPYALELDTVLREARVPTDLQVYADETHLPNRPRTLRAAMAISTAWFDFWLRGSCDAPQYADRCASWARLQSRWRTTPEVIASATAKPQKDSGP